MKRIFNLTFLLCFLSSLVFGQVVLEKHDKMNKEALRFWYSDASKPSHKFNRNISPRGDCMQVINGYLFFTWYKGGMTTRNLMLSRLNLATNQWVEIQFPDKSSLYGSGQYQGGGNSHRTAAVGVSPIDGTVHLVYDMHADELKYRVSQKNIAFVSDADFTLDKFSSKRNYFKEGEPIPSFTYPNIQVNDAGELILEYRLGTSRQGDKYLIVYSSNGWSSARLVMQGNNENPEYNQYGGFGYFFGQLYMGCSVRIKGDPIEFNQGFYFASLGQNGVTGRWKALNGTEHNIPIKGMTQMNRLRVARPLPNGSNGMTSAPNFVVSKNGAVHFTNRVPGSGTVHYYSAPNSSTMERASGGSPNVSFPADDGRIYSIELSNSKLRVQSTKEGTNNWRTDYTWSGTEKFGLFSYEYRNGKIYIIASEEIESDKLPLHYIVLNLTDIDGNDPTIVGPEGYSYSSPESEVVTITDTPYDLAYGFDGNFVYLKNQTTSVTCSNDAFGSDPVPGTKKYCFVKESKMAYGGLPMSIPGTIEAEDYDFGGPEISYSDTDSENRGAVESSYRINSGVDIGAGNGGRVIGWTSNNEWTEYSITVESSGDYELEFFVSSKNGGGKLGIDLNGGSLIAGIDVPQTGDWNTYTSFKKNTSLEQGDHLMRFKIENSGFNLDKVVFNKRITTNLSEFQNTAVSVFPNPSVEGLFRLSQLMEYKVYNLKGVLILQGKGDQIDLSNEVTGVYTLQIGANKVMLIK